jgi:hypothetical protein
MLTLIERICERLKQGAYVNEAAISHGVVTPILSELGWDSADPAQLVPEYRVDNGFVDFALLGLNHKPAIFIEVKGLGRATDGDRQLFGYAFHHGVPLCVLTDGREWSFYLPSGVGSYEDRRVYRLQLDERSPAECSEILQRYLSRERVRSGEAFADAHRDHQNAVGGREAVAMLPSAWGELVTEAHELLVETLADKTEALSGYRPGNQAVETFLRSLTPGRRAEPPPTPKIAVLARPPAEAALAKPPAEAAAPKPTSDKSVTYTLFGQSRVCANASQALVEILRELANRDPARLPALADAVRTARMAHIARTPEEINPRNVAIARAIQIAPGWMVGLNIDNRTKMAIIRAACEVWQIKVPDDLQISMPNA